MNTYGLNIHLQSFFLNRSLVQSGDKIRVSITSIPEECKEAFVVSCDKSNSVHHFFTINATDQTKKIIFVFRKKSFINNDPIIASTIVHVKDLPKSATDTNNTEMKTIDIYEPIQQMHHTTNSVQNRRVFGQMQIQFTPTGAFPNSSIKDKSKSNQLKMITLTSTNKSYNGYGHVSNENQNHQQAYSQYDNQGLFVDPDPEQIKNLNKYEFQYQQQNQNQNQNEFNDQYQQPQNQYQQPQNQYQQPQNQYQQPQQYQYQQQPQNQYQQPQNQYQQQPNNMVFVNDLI